MRAAYEQVLPARAGYTADEFRAVAEQVAGTSLKSVLGHRRRPAPQELDYTEALDVVRPALPVRVGAGRPAGRRVAGRRRRATTRAAWS